MNLRILIILLLTPITGATIDIYVPSLPAIAHYLHTSNNLVQLTVPIYLLGYSTSQLFIGALSDVIGRRILIITGLIFFILVSFLATLSVNIEMLLAMRFLQGIAATAPGLARPVASDSFSGGDLSKIFNYTTIAWAVGPIIAPVIGGYLQFYFQWKAPFYFLVGYAAITLALVYFYLPETLKERQPLHLITWIRNYKTVISHPQFIGSIFILTGGYSYLIFFNVIGPLLIQNTLHYSSIEFGHMALLLGLAWFLGNCFNRYLIKRFSVNVITQQSILLVIAANIVLLGFALYPILNLWVLILPMWVMFFAAAICFTNYFSQCLSLFPNIAGTASAAMSSLFITMTAGIGVLASFLSDKNQIPLAWSFIVLSLMIFFINYYLSRLALESREVQ